MELLKMSYRTNPIFALGIAAIALSGIAPASPVSFAGPAYAKNEKSGDHGGGGGKGGNGGGRSEKSGGGKKGGASADAGKNFSSSGSTAKTKSSGKPTKSASAAPKKSKPSAEETEIAAAFEVDDGTKFASELKGLNAYHASAQAWENASPNSRVGRIAAYRDAALATTETGRLAEEAAATLAEKQDTRDGIQRDITDLDADYSARNAEIDEKIAGLDAEAEDYDAQVAALEAERPSAEDYAAQKTVLSGQLAEAEVSLANTKAELAEAQMAAGTAAQTEDEALMAATDGRVLSDEALAYFREKIGLDTP